MPVTIPSALPARRILEGENVFVMTDDRAAHQDIRPLRIAIGISPISSKNSVPPEAS